MFLFLPLWHQCTRCGYARDCRDPFAPDGCCPHPAEAAQVPPAPHPPVHAFDLERSPSPVQQRALATNARFASLYERARRNLFLHNHDFAYLRDLALPAIEAIKSPGDGVTTLSEYDIHNWNAGSLPPAVELLYDVFHPALAQFYQDFGTYYGERPSSLLPLRLPLPLTPDLLWAGLPHTLIWAIDHATPARLAQCEPIGLDWQDFLLEIVRLGLWAALVRSYLPLEHLEDDARFRSQFEQEWRRLLDYRGLLFNFRVVPLLSPQALARYQALPRGDGSLRNMIASYVVHQATAYPHLPNDLWPDLHAVLYKRQLRRLFTPLVQSQARLALQSLGGAVADKKRLKADVTGHMWRAYDEAVDRFRFDFPYKGKPSPLGKQGILGLAESEDERQRFDAFLEQQGVPLESTDLTHVLFTRYLERRLTAWRLSAYPPPSRESRAEPLMTSLDAPPPQHEEGRTLGDTLGDTLSSGLDQDYQDDEDASDDLSSPLLPSTSSSWVRTNSAVLQEPPDAVGPSGEKYYLIEKTARRLGAGVSQLRHIERNGGYTSLRARDVPGPLEPPLPPATRLYPATEETDQALRIALDRSRTHAGRLRGQELTRKQAAAVLGVPQSRLRSWERGGRLSPPKRGKSVVYGPDLLEQAKALMSNQATP